MMALEQMAVVVLAREPVVDWVNEVNPEHPIWLDDLAWRGNVYLIPRVETLEESEAHVEQIFDDIFRNELSEWVEDEDRWPKERTYEMFLDWFDVIYDVVAYDTQAKDGGG